MHLHQEPSQDVFSDLRNVLVNRQRRDIVDRANRKDLTAGRCVEDDHFRSAVITVQSSGNDMSIRGRTRSSLVRFMARRSAGASTMQAGCAENLAMLQTGSVEDPVVLVVSALNESVSVPALAASVTVSASGVVAVANT